MFKLIIYGTLAKHKIIITLSTFSSIQAVGVNIWVCLQHQTCNYTLLQVVVRQLFVDPGTSAKARPLFSGKLVPVLGNTLPPPMARASDWRDLLASILEDSLHRKHHINLIINFIIKSAVICHISYPILDYSIINHICLCIHQFLKKKSLEDRLEIIFNFKLSHQLLGPQVGTNTLIALSRPGCA